MLKDKETKPKLFIWTELASSFKAIMELRDSSQFPPVNISGYFVNMTDEQRQFLFVLGLSIEDLCGKRVDA